MALFISYRLTNKQKFNYVIKEYCIFIIKSDTCFHFNNPTCNRGNLSPPIYSRLCSDGSGRIFDLLKIWLDTWFTQNRSILGLFTQNWPGWIEGLPLAHAQRATINSKWTSKSKMASPNWAVTKDPFNRAFRHLKSPIHNHGVHRSNLRPYRLKIELDLSVWFFKRLRVKLFVLLAGGVSEKSKRTNFRMVPYERDFILQPFSCFCFLFL